MAEITNGTGVPVANIPDGRLRNLLIFGSIGLFAAIIFGLLYLFVIAPAAPAGGQGWSTGWFLFSFATGLTMIVMPCTLPLAFVIVPLSMGKGLVKGISMALAFGIGVTVTLSLYGVAAALIGAYALDTLGAPLEVVKNWVYFIAGIFALVFALSEIGLLNVHMPTYSGAAPAFIQKRQEIFKAFLLGLFLGNIGVGCPHPATPLLLIEIASSGDVLYGWLMFLIHAIGRVLPLLLLAFLAILGVNGLNWLMTRKDIVEKVTGWAMVFVAGFILTLGLFTHDWWVNSGLHSGLEVLTQEAFFNRVLNENFDTAVAHVHGLEDGTGLFGLPLWLGHWFLVFVWLLPIWWWWSKRKKILRSHPSVKMRELERKIDLLERDRRQVESMVNLDELETSFDLKARHAQLDALETERRKVEADASYGETGDFKSPIAQTYEFKILKMHRNYLIAISIFLILIFVYFMPKNFYLKSMSGGDHHAMAPSNSISTVGAHAMPDGTVMNARGEIIPGATVAQDGSILFANGSSALSTRTMFTKSTVSLEDAVGPIFVDLKDGDTYNVSASYVKKEVGNRTLRMLAYNGAIPGPFIRTTEGATVTINFTNNTDIDQTIHSHGLRLDNRFDGVPDVTQPVVKPGESFTYTITFPDAGMAWYHPHTRDDYGQEMGLYGTYFVDSLDGNYWSPVNREVPLVIDDILIENNEIANFYKEVIDHALLGRFGNTYLVNGETDYLMDAQVGEVIRFLVTNVSNARTYKLSIPGAEMKIVGADLGRYEQETYENDFLISPAERMVVEVYFPKAGLYKLTHTTPTGQTVLANISVNDEKVGTSYLEAFNVARRNVDVKTEFDTLRTQYLGRLPDKSALLTVQLSGAVDHSAHSHGGTATGAVDESMPHSHGATDSHMSMGSMEGGMMAMMGGENAIQWDDPTNSDSVNSSENVVWNIVDQKTGKVSMAIDDWNFKVGQFVKIRFTNDMMAAHVMQHPIHFHGQRFLVLATNGVPNENMVWKDTALVLPGEYVDILVEMSNPGVWMAHCHISEHLHASMMLPFRVDDKNSYAPGDEYRATVPTTHTQSVGSTNAQMGTGIMTDPNAPQASQYNYGDAVPNDGFVVTPSTQSVRVGKEEMITLTFSDSQGNSMALNDALTRAFSVTFVSSDNAIRFVTYPGNTTFPMPMMHQNVPGTPGFDESMPHSHSFNFIPIAYAHGGVADEHMMAEGRTYTIPVKFSSAGKYRGFVSYTLAGEALPRVAVFDLEVGDGSWSVDNYGWSPVMKWWVLLIISIVLIVPLTWFVRRYINEKDI